VAAGLYAAAFHIASVVTLLAGYISVVSQPRIVAWVRDRRAAGFVRLNMLLGIAASIVIIGVSYLLPQLVIWVFGDAYAAARPLLTILLFGACLDLLIMPVLLTFALQLLPRQALVTEAVIAAVFFATVFTIDGLDPMTMAWIVSAVRGAKLLSYLGIFVFRQDAAQSSSSL
jgi:O-antigen/teichoic acid export membrane protein